MIHLNLFIKTCRKLRFSASNLGDIYSSDVSGSRDFFVFMNGYIGSADEIHEAWYLFNGKIRKTKAHLLYARNTTIYDVIDFIHGRCVSADIYYSVQDSDAEYVVFAKFGFSEAGADAGFDFDATINNSLPYRLFVSEDTKSIFAVYKIRRGKFKTWFSEFMSEYGKEIFGVLIGVLSVIFGKKNKGGR